MSLSLLNAYASDSSDDDNDNDDVKAPQNSVSSPSGVNVSGSKTSVATSSAQLCVSNIRRHKHDFNDRHIKNNEKLVPISQHLVASTNNSEAGDATTNAGNSVLPLQGKLKSHCNMDSSLNMTNIDPVVSIPKVIPTALKKLALPTQTNSDSKRRKLLDYQPRNTKDTTACKPTQSKSDFPADFIAELQREGHDLSSVNFVDVDMRAASSAPTRALLSSHVSQNIVHKTANRIVKASNVSRLERRRHQITALAAEASAVQIARQTMPDIVARGRRGRRR